MTQTDFLMISVAQTRSRPLGTALPMTRLRLLVAGCVALVSCALEPAGNPPADQLRIGWQVLSDSSLGEGSFDSELILSNHSDQILGSDWVIYFSYFRTVLPEPDSAGARVEHLNGDYFRLLPEPGFRLEREAEARIRFRSRGSPVNQAQGPSGFYLVYGAATGEPLPVPGSIKSRVLPFPAGSSADIPTAESRFRAAANVQILPKDSVTPVIPTPVSFRRTSRTVVLTSRFQIRHEPGLEFEAAYLSDELEKLMGTKLNVAAGDRGAHNTILLRRDRVRVGRAVKRAGGEAYGLLVSPAIGIQIVGTDRATIFYGIQTLRALFPADAYLQVQEELSIPGIDITDAPRFLHRGLHLDVARNFQPPELLEKLLDLMAFYKLNVLHLHLTDDEGWRLEIPGLSELTEVGGHRGHTFDESETLLPSFGSGPDSDPAVSSGSGFYTREDFLGILEHASRRNIRIVPEIDLPGHARAAVKSMEARYRRLLDEDPVAAAEFVLSDQGDTSQYVSAQGWSDNVVNVCRDSTYRWFGTVVDELVKMYEEADLELKTLHVGGDEVPTGAWESSPDCQKLLSSGIEGVPSGPDQLLSYFLTRVSKILQERSLTVAGWEEAALALMEHSEVAADLESSDGPGSKLVANVWHSAKGTSTMVELARAGFPVILSNADHLYFDLAYESDPQEPGLSWAGFVDTRKTWEFQPLAGFQALRREIEASSADTRLELRDMNQARAKIIGIQAQLWGELLKSRERLEYMAFPRLLALAERAWSPQPVWAEVEDSEQRELLMRDDWVRFANALGQVELPRLDRWFGGGWSIACLLLGPWLRRVFWRPTRSFPVSRSGMRSTADH